MFTDLAKSPENLHASEEPAMKQESIDPAIAGATR